MQHTFGWAVSNLCEAEVVQRFSQLKTPARWYRVVQCWFWKPSKLLDLLPPWLLYDVHLSLFFFFNANCSLWVWTSCLVCISISFGPSGVLVWKIRPFICWILKPSVGVRFFLRTLPWCVVCLPFIAGHVKHHNTLIRLKLQTDKTMGAHTFDRSKAEGWMGLSCRARPCTYELCTYANSCIRAICKTWPSLTTVLY